MTDQEDSFRADLRKKLAERFQGAADPEKRYHRIAGDAEAIKDVRAIEERAERLKRELLEHQKRQKNQRINKEIERQTKRKTALTSEHPSPTAVNDRRRLSAAKIRADAKHAVQGRMDARLQRLERAASRMIEARISRSERSSINAENSGKPSQGPEHGTTRRRRR